MRRRFPFAALTVSALMMWAGPARAAATPAAGTEFTVSGWTKAPGPRSFDRLAVTRYGRASARTVLVLLPGTYGGRGDFAMIGPELVRRVPGLQVWAPDRRSERLEDTRVFDDALAGRTSTKAMLDHYVGWLTDPSITTHFTPPDTAKMGFVADWGLRVYMEDTRRVIARARRDGRRVLLGGHSLGASATLAYAGWDFGGGHRGGRDIDGMVLLDGGLRGAFHETVSAAEATSRLKAIRKQPFLDLLGLGVPWAAGVLAQAGAVAAVREPDEPSALQALALVPPSFKPPMPVTNRTMVGYAFDETTSSKALALIHARMGDLGPDGAWHDGEVTRTDDFARVFAHSPGNATEWFYPARLNLDVDAASPMRETKAARSLGVRIRFARQIDVPVYAIQSSLTHGHVLRGVRRSIRDSRIRRLPARDRVLVDASATDSHLDPLTAAPARSRFLKSAVPWLRRQVR